MESFKGHFKKLKIYTLLDLALLIPSSYDDTTLSDELKVGTTHTLEAKVVEVNTTGGKLLVRFYLPRFNTHLSSLFFRVTPYHYQTFALHKELTIQGRLELFHSSYQINQPKTVKRSGTITPKYKTILKEEEMRLLISHSLTPHALTQEGLLPHEVETLLELHAPQDLSRILHGGSLHPKVLQVLKSVEAYNHIKKLSAKRIDYPATAPLTGDTTEFIKHLPFTLTDEQNKTIEEIRADLSRSNRATKRMVVGDVGSGKTMVILAAAMMALPHTSILMAPTSLLAIQIYEEAMKHLPKSLRIALVMQNKNEGEYQNAHLIIGTHALLYKEDLPNAKLVMIDEQHRFGTKQRQMLEALVNNESEDGKRIHQLQFSATPIPRTQAMMNAALIDISLITKTPFEKSIKTRVIGKGDFPKLLTHIREEISMGHQVLIVYPLVEESETIAYQSLQEGRGFWEERFDNVFVTHGKDKQKEEVLLEFRQSGDILLATTVVEVGISLPRLTLVVIVAAERLGLSTLHQLRGRVGRLGLESTCYLFTHLPTSPRLEEFSRTTSGFDIATLDLKFREGGDILDGTIQSGQKFRWLDMGEDEEIVQKAKGRVDK